MYNQESSTERANQIEEILNEMSECREDERSTQNQIIQVIAAAGAILAFIFGTSSFTNVSKSILFHLSNMVLCAATGYTATLGIQSIIRYHYYQDLEVRLAKTTQGEHNPKDGFMHWITFSASITTKNIKHLKSKYTIIYYLLYAIAVIFSVLLCVVITFVQYSFLEKYSIIDRIAFSLLVAFLAYTIFSFFYCTFKAEDIYFTAVRLSCQKVKESSRGISVTRKPSGRKNKASASSFSNLDKSNARELIRAFLYYIFPKNKDFQKIFLLIIGFFSGQLLSNNFSTRDFPWKKLLIALIVIEFLIYQARYQWNDIRGLREDREAKKKDRLPIYILSERKAVIISLLTILLRVSFAIAIIFLFSEQMALPLLICSTLIIVLTFCYESARKKGRTIMVFVFVSLGYPLRFFTGFWAACPEFFDKSILLYISNTACAIIRYLKEGIVIMDSFPKLFVFLLFLSYAFWGVSCVILAWTHEAAFQRKQGIPLRSHYELLLGKVSSYNDNNPFSSTESRLISKPWNTTYLISVFLLSAISLTVYSFHPTLIISELLLLVFSILVINSQKCKKSLWPLLTIVTLKSIMAVCSTPTCYLYFYFSITQAVFAISYYYLINSYNPSISFASFLRNALLQIIIWIIGPETAHSVGLLASGDFNQNPAG